MVRIKQMQEQCAFALMKWPNWRRQGDMFDITDLIWVERKPQKHTEIEDAKCIVLLDYKKTNEWCYKRAQRGRGRMCTSSDHVSSTPLEKYEWGLITSHRDKNSPCSTEIGAVFRLVTGPFSRPGPDNPGTTIRFLTSEKNHWLTAEKLLISGALWDWRDFSKQWCRVTELCVHLNTWRKSNWKRSSTDDPSIQWCILISKQGVTYSRCPIKRWFMSLRHWNIFICFRWQWKSTIMLLFWLTTQTCQTSLHSTFVIYCLFSTYSPPNAQETTQKCLVSSWWTLHN